MAGQCVKHILLIAPSHPDLPSVSSEVAEIASTHRVELLQGTVTEADVKNAAIRHEYDVIWFATHGGPSGVVLSNGTALDKSAVVQYVKASKAELAMFNTCESVALAQAVVEEARVDVICTISKVPDITAMRTGQLFSRRLVDACDYRRAYEESKPGRNVDYLYLAGYQGPVARSREDGSSDEDDLGQRSNVLTEVLVRNLLESLAQVKADVTTIKTDVAVLKQAERQRGTPPQWVIWFAVFLAILSFALSVTDTFVIFGHLLGK